MLKMETMHGRWVKRTDKSVRDETQAEIFMIN